MAYPDAWIYVCGPDGLARCAYEDTEHVQITRSFLADPQRMLALLMNDDAASGGQGGQGGLSG